MIILILITIFLNLNNLYYIAYIVIYNTMITCYESSNTSNKYAFNTKFKIVSLIYIWQQIKPLKFSILIITIIVPWRIKVVGKLAIKYKVQTIYFVIYVLFNNFTM